MNIFRAMLLYVLFYSNCVHLRSLICNSFMGLFDVYFKIQKAKSFEPCFQFPHLKNNSFYFFLMLLQDIRVVLDKDSLKLTSKDHGWD